MMRILSLAQESKKLISDDSDLDVIGEMLNESWEIKKVLNPSSTNDRIEEIFSSALKAGALGGKVLGAGGGGFCMFWVKNGQRDNFLRNMPNLVNVPIRISQTGSVIVSQ